MLTLKKTFAVGGMAILLASTAASPAQACGRHDDASSKIEWVNKKNKEVGDIKYEFQIKQILRCGPPALIVVDKDTGKTVRIDEATPTQGSAGVSQPEIGR